MNIVCVFHCSWNLLLLWMSGEKALKREQIKCMTVALDRYFLFRWWKFIWKTIEFLYKSSIFHHCEIFKLIALELISIFYYFFEKCGDFLWRRFWIDSKYDVWEQVVGYFLHESDRLLIVTCFLSTSKEFII